MCAGFLDHVAFQWIRSHSFLSCTCCVQRVLPDPLHCPTTQHVQLGVQLASDQPPQLIIVQGLAQQCAPVPVICLCCFCCGGAGVGARLSPAAVWHAWLALDIHIGDH
jgi:hypothetical protein